MKTNILLVMLGLLIAGCDSNFAQPNPQPPIQKAIVVQVEDFSKSTYQVNYFDTPAVDNLIRSISNANGGTLKLIGVYENSALQNILTLQIEPIDTVTSEAETNPYKKSRTREANRKKIGVFEEKLQSYIIRYAAASIKPHTGKYTDLTSSLALAKATLNQPIFDKGYNKYLLLCSDCLNNVKGKRHAKLQPIELHNTTVLIVRPSLSIPEAELKGLFPLSKVYVFTDINDAIAMIK